MAGGGPVSRHAEAELGSHERIHRGDTVRCYTAKVDPSAISKVGFIENWQDDHEDSFWICRRTQERSFWSCCSVISFNLCGLTSNKFTHLKHAPIDLNRSTASKFQWALAVETPARTTCRWLFAWHDLKIGWYAIRQAAQILSIFLWCSFGGTKNPQVYAVCLWCLLILMSSPFPIHFLVGFWSPKKILRWSLACFLVQWEWEQRDELILLAQENRSVWLVVFLPRA